MENKHKHYDMIVAKAANMDLVVLCKFKGAEWVESRVDWHDSFNFLCEYEYFLCLPQHKEACLCWLNGGSAQYLSNRMGKWIDFGDSKSWSIKHLFMTDECELRIKPKKEKRWIAYVKDQKRVGVLTFDSEHAIKTHYGDKADSFHEIEVEVKPKQQGKSYE